MAKEKSKEHAQSERAISAIAYAAIAGCLGIALFAVQTASFRGFYSVLGVGLLIACSSMITGCLAGFLFGIPKTMQQETQNDSPGTQGKPAQTGDRSTRYQTNTNLEQISDWLTKILVGVGLTQLTSLPEILKKYADFASPGLGGNPASRIFSVVILVLYLVCGFLIAYLWTRLYLKGEFISADKESVDEKIDRIDTKISEIEKQAEIDEKAMSFAMRQLNSDIETSPMSQDEVNAIIFPASSKVKSQIFWQARDIRTRNWKDEETKPQMERTIPIFRALALSDKNKVFHLNHGQLGYALKDKLDPDLEEAESELSKAIEIRDKSHDKGHHLLYEFNRALCRIQKDKGFLQNKASDKETKQKIISDLKAVSYKPALKNLINETDAIQEWLKINKAEVPEK